MKTNKISVMLLSAALACTPILTSTAQIAAFAAETTTVTTADAAVAVPVDVNPDAAVAAAAGDDETDAPTAEPASEANADAEPTTAEPETQPASSDTTAAVTTAANTTATTKTTLATTAKPKSGGFTLSTEAVDENQAAIDAAVHDADDMDIDLSPDHFKNEDSNNDGIVYTAPDNETVMITDPYGYATALITDADAFNKAVKNNPNFNPYDGIYKFRVPNPNEGKMLYTPNPRWFINTPAAPCNTDDGESATITWEPVPGADGYRYTIRTYVMQPDQDSHDYAFTHQHYAGDPDGRTVLPVNVDGNAVSTLLDDDGNVIESITQTDHAANNYYKNHKFETIFRVKEDITINGRFQEQDSTTNYTRKENWKEFTGVDKDVVVGYTYDLEHPHVTVSSTQTVRIEICIQAFKIDNATGEMYNLSDVSDPRVVDLNWVAGESWEGWAGMPDQYEDEFFRAGYHTLKEPEAPNGYVIVWDSLRIPIHNDRAQYGFSEKSTYGRLDKDNKPHTDWEVNYLELNDNTMNGANGANLRTQAKNLGIECYFENVPEYDALTGLPTGNTVRTWHYKESFDLKGFNPSEKPALYELASNLDEDEQERLKRINQAITDDFDRKVRAYNEWKRLNLDPITKWNNDHKTNIDNGWRIAYKECVTAYAQSQFVENKGYDMRYGLLDLDGNGVPELIISFLKNESKNSYVVIDWQADRAKLRTVHDKYGTEWYYEDVLGGCAHRGRCYKLDYLGPIDQWKPEDDNVDPLASTTSGSSSASSSASSSGSASGSASNAAATAGTAGAPQTGDAGVAGLVGAAAAAVAGMFASFKLRRKDQ